MNTITELHLVMRDGKPVAIADNLDQAHTFAETVSPDHHENYWTATGKLFAVSGGDENVFKWTGWEVRPIIHTEAS
ncbi:hypothetical protein [Streptomyces sp. NPDC057686]|uniref:hypothetical protein n=1 Tax=Streptomyces sp. NPDC057686 TaxID=3346212 RepID=UPI0036B301BD